jgi:MYXO-CTERM domain-containing protein
MGGFSFFVATDFEGTIVNWSIFAEAQQSLGGQLLETHQIVSRTGGSALDRGILFVDDMGSRLGTDIGLNGTPGSWARAPIVQMILVADRADDVFTPGAEFLLEVDVSLNDVAAADLTSVTAAFGGTVLPLVQENLGEWEGETAFADFAALEAEIDGAWTVTLTGGALASTNTFLFDTSALTDADFFATPTNLSPGNGEAGVAADVVLSWDDPTGPSLRTPDALVVLAESATTDQEANNLVDMMDPNYIALDATTWDPVDDLEAGVTEFAVFYADADDSFVSTIVVTPPGTVAWGPPDFFPIYPSDKPFLALASETLVEFSVPEPSSSALAVSVLGVVALLARRRRGQT